MSAACGDSSVQMHPSYSGHTSHSQLPRVMNWRSIAIRRCFCRIDATLPPRHQSLRQPNKSNNRAPGTNSLNHRPSLVIKQQHSDRRLVRTSEIYVNQRKRKILGQAIVCFSLHAACLFPMFEHASRYIHLFNM